MSDTEVIDDPSITPPVAYNEITVGTVRGDQQIGFHVYIDDVVIARQRIGCQ